MAKIVKTNLGKYCYIWFKGNRVPVLGVVGYAHDANLMTIRNLDGVTTYVDEADISYITRAC